MAAEPVRLSDMTSSTQESSVLFNLRQLMQLQDERVAAEEHAMREQRAAQAEAQQREREARAERERQAQLEREAALLRLQLEAAAAQRARDAEQERAHALQLEAAAAQRARDTDQERAHALQLARLPSRTGRLPQHAALLLSALSCVGALWLADAHAGAAAQQAQAAAAEQARELEAVRRQVKQLLAAAQPAAVHVSPAPTQAQAARSTPPVARIKPGPQRVRGKPKPPHEGSQQGELDVDLESKDPLQGLDR